MADWLQPRRLSLHITARPARWRRRRADPGPGGHAPEGSVSLMERACDFAVAAHGDQKRKYTGDPYVTHTQEVADIIGNTPSIATT